MTGAATLYALFDQEETRRVTERQQPGACLQCHAANLALYRFVGKGDVQKGFEQVSGMPYREARELKDDKGQPLVQHPVSCVDCHDPKTMGLRVTRPGFLAGIRALKAKQGLPTTTRIGTPPVRRCARSCAASATSSTTSRARARS